MEIQDLGVLVPTEELLFPPLDSMLEFDNPMNGGTFYDARTNPQLSPWREEAIDNLFSAVQDNLSANENSYNISMPQHSSPSEVILSSIKNIPFYQDFSFSNKASISQSHNNKSISPPHSNFYFNSTGNDYYNPHNKNNNKLENDPHCSNYSSISPNNYLNSSHVENGSDCSFHYEEPCTSNSPVYHNSSTEILSQSSNFVQDTFQPSGLFVNSPPSYTSTFPPSPNSSIVTPQMQTQIKREGTLEPSHVGNGIAHSHNYPVYNSLEVRHLSPQTSNFVEESSLSGPSAYRTTVPSSSNSSMVTPQIQTQINREEISVPHSSSPLSNLFNNNFSSFIRESHSASSAVYFAGPPVNTTTVSASTDSSIFTNPSTTIDYVGNNFLNNACLPTPPNSPPDLFASPESDATSDITTTSDFSESPGFIETPAIEEMLLDNRNIDSDHPLPFISTNTLEEFMTNCGFSDLGEDILPSDFTQIFDDYEDRERVSMMDSRTEQNNHSESPIIKQDCGDIELNSLAPVVPEEIPEYFPETPGLSDEDRASSPLHNSNVAIPTPPLEQPKNTTLSVVSDHTYCKEPIKNEPMNHAPASMSPIYGDSSPPSSAHVKRQLKNVIYDKSVQKRKVGRPPKSVKVFDSRTLTFHSNVTMKISKQTRGKPDSYTKLMQDNHEMLMKKSSRIPESPESITDRNSKRRRTTANDPQDNADRRTNHNTMERKRRDDLKQCLSHLRVRVPAIADNPKASKATILNQSEKYIKEMELEDVKLNKKKYYEKSKNLTLQKRLKELKDSIRGYNI